MRARKEGFLLSPTAEGREGGVATSKAKDVIVSTPVRIPGGWTDSSVNAHPHVAATVRDR